MNQEDAKRKLQEIEETRAAIAARDAEAAQTMPLGSNEPLATDRLRAVFQNGEALSAAAAIRAVRAAGYRGPDSRIVIGLRRLIDTQELKFQHGKYSKS